MKRTSLIKAFIVAASLAGMGVGTAIAQNPLKTQDQLRTQDKDMDKDQDHLRDQDRLNIYGYELMTDQERNAYQERMRAAKTLQERDSIRAEHRVQMDARAKERGATILHRDGGRSGNSASSGSGSGSGSGGGAGAGAGMGGKK
ncbi:MAG TPA: hypothetical protein VIN35_07035 [Hydrogenophaga sp.]